MVLTLAIGVLIITVGLTIDTVFGRLRREPTKYKKEQWMAEEVLELDKAAYSGLGIWRETGVDMPPSSILLRPPPSHVPFQESQKGLREDVGVQMAKGCIAVSNEVL